jgi:hypothetical protein
MSSTLAESEDRLLKRDAVRYLGGSALVGVSGALLAALIRLGIDEAKKPKLASSRTATTQVAVPLVKTAGIPENAALLTGSIGAAGLSYVVTAKLLRALEKRKVAQEIEEARENYAKLLSQNAVRKESSFSGAASALLSVPLLLALAAGIGTNKILDHQFPKVRKKPKESTKIIVTQDGEEEEDELAEELAEARAVYKGASDGSIVFPDELEGLLKLCSALPCSSTAAVLKVASTGKLEAMNRMAEDGVFADCVDRLLPTVPEPSDQKLAMAAHAIPFFPSLSKAAGLVAASDFATRCPFFTHAAREHMREGTEPALTGVFVLHTASEREGLDAVAKSAGFEEVVNRAGTKGVDYGHALAAVLRRMA